MPRTEATRRLSKRLHQHRDGVRFCLLFSIFTLLAFLLLYALHRPFVVPFTQLIARATYETLRAAGVQVWVAGASVGIPGFAVEIKNNCNAVYEIGLFAAAVFAFPAPAQQRLTGFLLGAAVLYLVNLIRVLSLLALGRYWPGGFQAAHLYVWQAIFLAVVAALWLGWVARVRRVA
ncbi:MAG: archaeosortase/exosortase family protein [Candidatus Methylomirabilis oxyfera]|nr:archaeosortase/exosortase family protein [Candidatus Methylomirabilis oxyfera]